MPSATFPSAPPLPTNVAQADAGAQAKLGDSISTQQGWPVIEETTVVTGPSEEPPPSAVYPQNFDCPVDIPKLEKLLERPENTNGTQEAIFRRKRLQSVIERERKRSDERRTRLAGLRADMAKACRNVGTPNDRAICDIAKGEFYSLRNDPCASNYSLVGRPVPKVCSGQCPESYTQEFYNEARAYRRKYERRN